MKNMKKNTSLPGAAPKQAELDYALLEKLVDRAFYLALKMIDVANNRPVPDKGEPKVGGHPSACASSKHILSAIHLVLREPEDYFACKPHVSPMDHALNYLLQNFRDHDGNPMPADQRKLAMQHLRHFSPSGEPVFQSYHAEADPDSFRYFPSGSVGIPPVNALYTALAYNFAADHQMELGEKPTFWCLMGDSEFREGSLMEAMPDAGERELNQLVWIVDYNRQNLDGTRVSNEKALGGSDADRIVRLSEANGWRAVKLKHGKKRERLFATAGGDEFKRVLDECLTDFEFQALITSNNAPLIRKHLSEKSAQLATWMKKYSDTELHEAFFNLAGHDLASLVEAFTAAKSSDKPTLIVAYTIKGLGLQCQAMSGNHSSLPESDELAAMAKRIGADENDPFAEFPANSPEEAFLRQRREVLVTGIERIIGEVNKRRESWYQIGRSIDWPVDFEVTALKFNPVAHTQWMWGQVAAKIDRIARGDGKENNPSELAWKKVAPLFLTMAPDVGSSTNTSPNMNGKLYGDVEQEDYDALFNTKDHKAPDIMPKADRRTGHLRFEIAEGNCMSAAGSFGKFGYFVGIPFYPAMTIYDFFIKRAHDQFYYNLYWHSNFATIGTPSGVTLAAEGAQHSWKSDFQIPNCVTWEPCFAKELEWILADTLRRHFTGDNVDREGTLVRCVTKGIVQKEFAERLKRQTRFKSDSSTVLSVENQAEVPSLSEEEIFEAIRRDTLAGGYALADYRGYADYTPGDNVVHIFALGVLAGEALRASDALLEKGIYANVFVVTSPDLLLGNYAYLDGFKHLKENLGINGDLFLNPAKGAQIESEGDWYSLQSSRVPVVSVHDGEPGLLDNIGSIVGVKQKTLAIRKTSKSGFTPDIYHYHHIDPEGIITACEEILTDAAGETFQVARSFLERFAGGGAPRFDDVAAEWAEGPDTLSGQS
jgi:pyruvate dehydrogenase E1 component